MESGTSLARTFRSNSVLRLLLGWAVFLALLGLYWFQLLSFHDRQLAGTEQGAMLRADQAAHALAMQGHAKLLKIEFFLDHLTEHWMDHDPEVFGKLIELGAKGHFQGLAEPDCRRRSRWSGAIQQPQPAGCAPDRPFGRRQGVFSATSGRAGRFDHQPART